MRLCSVVLSDLAYRMTAYEIRIRDWSSDVCSSDLILFTDIRFEPYANVIFDHNIYEARKTVRDYLFSLGIETIGVRRLHSTWIIL